MIIKTNIRRKRELVREVKYLRSIAKDVVDRYSLRINARLADIARIVDSPDTKKPGVRKPNDKVICEMLSCIRSLKVKPKKGRVKDLARIEDITKKLNDLMPSQP